jgi:hypothetical protein
VLVNDLNLVGIAIFPAETDAPLIVHANTVLTGAITPELLQSIARRNAEVLEPLGRIHCHKFAQHRALEIRGVSPDGLASEQTLGIAIGEGLNHSES